MLNIRLGSALCAILISLASMGACAQPNFTGEVSSDFSGANTVTIADPGGKDISMPEEFPGGAVSGWDIRSVAFYYDNSSDTMYVGIDFYGIAGDADGDGDPGGAGDVMAGLNMTDDPNLGGSESVGIFFDLDLDGVYDLFIGDSTTTDITGFGARRLDGEDFLTDMGDGLSPDPAVLFANPSSEEPDLEFSIARFSKLPGMGPQPMRFGFFAFAGSAKDGLGEDTALGAVGVGADGSLEELWPDGPIQSASGKDGSGGLSGDSL